MQKQFYSWCKSILSWRVYTYTTHRMLGHCNLMIMYLYSKLVIYLPECSDIEYAQYCKNIIIVICGHDFFACWPCSVTALPSTSPACPRCVTISRSIPFTCLELYMVKISTPIISVINDKNERK